VELYAYVRASPYCYACADKEVLELLAFVRGTLHCPRDENISAWWCVCSATADLLSWGKVTHPSILTWMESWTSGRARCSPVGSRGRLGESKTPNPTKRDGRADWSFSWGLEMSSDLGSRSAAWPFSCETAGSCSVACQTCSATATTNRGPDRYDSFLLSISVHCDR
jgi:hypothetical protein